MQSMRSAGAASVGARVLGEIEETTLDEVRDRLQLMGVLFRAIYCGCDAAGCPV